MMNSTVDGIVSFARGNEITRNQIRSLMNQLIESVLPVGSRFTPHNRTGRVVCRLARASYVLAVRFHVPLLEISSKTVKILVIGQDGQSLGLVKVSIPYTCEMETKQMNTR